MRVTRYVLLIGACLLAGCSLFSGNEDPAAQPELTADDLAPTRGVPVQAVREIEIGRTRDGFVITAFGTAEALGYSLPRLRARRDGRRGPDGYLDYDFVATPPAPGLERPRGSIEARDLRADILLTQKDLRGVLGIRVHSLAGGLQLDF
ncbi:MAG: hypothetical protein AAF415_12185 [Pseudomonadota bacterium]